MSKNDETLNLNIKFNDFTKISETLYKNSFRLNVYTLECTKSKKEAYILVFQKYFSSGVLNLRNEFILNIDSKNKIDKYLLEVEYFLQYNHINF